VVTFAYSIWRKKQMTNILFSERKLAIMQIKQGKTQAEVAQLLNHSPDWVAKWYKRYKEKGWPGLTEQSRAPKKHGKRIATEVRVTICQTRLELEAEAASGEGLKYIGGQAIRTRLKKNKVIPLPSVPTIERVLGEAGLTQAKKETSEPEIVYPCLKPTSAHQLHQVDIVPHYLQGGERVFCFNAIDVVSRYPSGLAFAQHRAEDATAFLIRMWQEMGIADYTQVDNEGCFSGGATHPYVLGQVVRLALMVGTELLFSPVYHPKSNCFVERFHQDYNRHVWEDTYLEDLPAVIKKSEQFFPLYRLREDHDQLHEQCPTAIHQAHTPHQLASDFTLPAKKLPLREGCIHFMRRVTPKGTIRVLNVDWKIPSFDLTKGVWATIEFRTTGALLSIFDAAPDAPQRDCLATFSFPLKEPVLPFPSTTDLIGETETTLQTRVWKVQETLEPTKVTITEPVYDTPISSAAVQATTLSLLKPLILNKNLVEYGGHLALSTLQHTAHLTRQVFRTMY
jgi:transposase